MRRSWSLPSVARRSAVALTVAALALAAAEFAVRAVKSSRLDGILYLAGPSINTTYHPTLGWISRSSLSFSKCDDCYGSGVITYNDWGFRAPAPDSLGGSDVFICVIGDSTMQGYELPDSTHLPHLMAAELRRRYASPFVLPLAVGGWGSVQQWLAFEEYCSTREPDLVVWHWSENDPTNNSFDADRFSGPNSARPRPYLIDGRIVLKRPYPLHLSDRADDLMVMKVLNGVVLRSQRRDREERERMREAGWAVAAAIADSIVAKVPNRIALVGAQEERAQQMFAARGFEVAIYQPFLATERCLPRDLHPNALGHRRMFEALAPVVWEVLEGN